MAIGTDPTVANITTEGWNMAGVDNPTTAQLARADKWLQEVLNHIWLTSFSSGNTRLKSFENDYLDISVANTRTLPLPEDFDQEMSVQLWDSANEAPDNRGTSQGGGADNQIVLASDEDAAATDITGRYVIITGGVGVDQYRQIVGYNSTSKTLTVSEDWDTNPDSTSTYLLVTKTTFLERADIREFDDDSGNMETGIPTEFTVHERQMVFDRPFDVGVYGLFIRYHMHAHQINLTEGTSTRIVRLLRDFRHPLTVGIAYKAMQAEDNSEYQFKKQEFDQSVVALTIKDQPVSPFEGFIV